MQLFESIDQLTLPPAIECRIQELMQRESEGTLSTSDRLELDLLTEARQALEVIRSKAVTRLDAAAHAQIQPGRATRNGLPVVVVPAGTPAIDPVAVRRFLQEQVF